MNPSPELVQLKIMNEMHYLDKMYEIGAIRRDEYIDMMTKVICNPSQKGAPLTIRFNFSPRKEETTNDTR